MRFLPWAVILLVSNFAFIYGQQDNIQDDCDSQATCAACIKSRNCIWCDIVVDEREMKKSPVRCASRKNAEEDHWCSEGIKVNLTTNANFTKDLPLSPKKGSEQVQIRPQVVDLQLRRGEEYHLKVRYSQAEDYPVDLYFLVDLSSSMKKFLDALAELTDQIKEAMKNLTSNFQLGFGSFVDKKVRPMIVDGIDWNWSKHYTFKNHLQLTNDTERFATTVGGAPVIVTIDYPEGGFDGMMQTIVCKEEIGWRSNARHLLVHASDNSPHIAGDGRLAGIIEPNDEQCHLEKDTGLYTEGELQDYPSLGQINYQARKNNINIIFATLKKYTDIYEAVGSMIYNSAVGTFDPKPDNVVQLISKHYEQLVRSFRLTSNSTSKFLDIKFFSRCLDRDGELQHTDKCDGIRVNQTIEFDVVIKAIDCPEREEDWRQTIEIKPEGINEGVIVNVELMCGCECSKNSDKGENAIRASQCANKGILECGVCSCDPGYFGKSCECEGDKALAESDAFMSVCRKDNSSEICSGRGNCMCGSCSCHKQLNSDKPYYGNFCQCDDFSCRFYEGKLCAGHGHCNCENCVCDPGWIGLACECRDDPSQCFPPGNNEKICSGAGECKCGKCKCNKALGREGRFCEDCPSCPSQRCDEFKDCVECVIHRSGKIHAVDPHCQNCSKYDIHPVDEIEEDPDKINPGEHICRIAGNDGSTFVFKYVYPNGEDEDPVIIAEKNKEFRVIDDFLAATLGVMLLTLLIGLVILLLWKFATGIHDKREFEKFENERAQVHWARGQNPLYKSAVTTFKNPVFDSTLDDEDS